jgi:transcriptional regulator with XRE-family HTH domain
MPSGGLTKSLHTAACDRLLTLLGKARVDAGMTQAQAATRLGKPQSLLSKCESGERRVDAVELLAFCEAYDLKPEKFIPSLVA